MTDASRLEASLRTLRSEIESFDLGDAAARERLDGLVRDLEAALAHPGRASERATLGEQLRTSVLRLEAAHPRLAGIVNEVVESLVNMGI